MIGDTSSELLLATEVAQWLRISRSTLYGWAAAGKIPSVKLHGAIRFIRADIEHWIHHRSYVPTDSSPSMTHPIVAPNPSGVSRQMIHRAGIRAIRQVVNSRSSQQPSASGHLLPTADVGARKDTRS
jgi:excisionase family DNA binding protein